MSEERSASARWFVDTSEALRVAMNVRRRSPQLGRRWKAVRCWPKSLERLGYLQTRASGTRMRAVELEDVGG